MIWMTFEIAINFFQGFLLLMYVKGCFAYERRRPGADALLILTCAGFLTLLLLDHPPYLDQLLFAFPAAYALLLSSEKKRSILYWMAVLILIFSMISTVTYPIFELLPGLLRFSFPSYRAERFLCITATNILLLIVLNMTIQLKKGCPLPGSFSYAAFFLTLCAAFLVEESLYALFLSVGDAIAAPFFWAYVGLIAFTMSTVILFRFVSRDAEQKNRYQTEIAMLSLSRQHQQELSRMYENLTARQHDYRHHLQTLEQLVSGSQASTAKDYLSAVLHDAEEEEMIVTGSPEADALLTAKRRTMHEHGIEFSLSPYPLSDLPIAVSDFCAIVGNLLDNAIEGIQRIPDRCDRAYVHLSFSRSWNMFYIYCENPCEPTAISVKDGRLLSSKSSDMPQRHGIGLHSIKALAEKAEGRAEFQPEDRIFRAKVVLPYLDRKAS